MEQPSDMFAFNNEQFELFTDVEMFDLAMPSSDGVSSTGLQPDSEILDSDFIQANLLMEDINFDTSSWDELFPVQPNDYSPDLVTSISTDQLADYRRAPASISGKALVQAPSISTHIFIQPAPTAVLNVCEGFEKEVQSKNLLKTEFEQAMRAIHRKNGTEHVKLLENGPYQTFRINKKHQRIHKSGLKKKRLKKSEPRPCLLCRYLKRQCIPETPCKRCVEKSLGRRDLGFRNCVRDLPSDFNPFFTDSIPDEDLENFDFGLLSIFPAAYLHHQGKKTFHLNVVAWILCESFRLVNDGWGWSKYELLHPKVMLQLHSLHSWASNHAFKHLERAIQNRHTANVLEHWYLAMILYSFLDLPVGTREPVVRTEKGKICGRYLLEYILLLMNRCVSEISHNSVRNRQIKTLLQNVDIHNFVIIWSTEYIRLRHSTLPRTCYDAELTTVKLIMKTVGKIPWPSSLFREIREDIERDWWSPGFPTRPRLDYQKQLIGILSLFRKAIPEEVIEALDFSEMDFLLPLFQQGSGIRMGKCGTEAMERSWLDWQEEASMFSCKLCVCIIHVTTRPELSEVGISADESSTLWLTKVPSTWTNQGNRKPLQLLQKIFRCLVLLNLADFGIIELTKVLEFIQKTMEAPVGADHARFCGGWELAIQAMDEMMPDCHEDDATSNETEEQSGIEN